MRNQPEKLEIRKIVSIVEEIFKDEISVDQPIKRAVSIAVIKNPYASCGYVEDLDLLTEFGDYLGGILAKKALEALECTQDDVESFGKGCLVGEDGALEHAAALLHVRTHEKGFGKTFRDELNGGLAIMMANTKVGGMDSSIDVPLAHKDAAFVCSHWDTITVYVPGAPKRDELLVIGVVTNGGRPNARVPGLAVEEISVFDGQR